MINVFKQGDFITAVGLNKVNEAKDVFGGSYPSIYDDPTWWPQSGDQGSRVSKVYLADGAYYRIVTWDRKAGGNNADASINPPGWTNGWHWFPSTNGMYLPAGSSAFFRYWYDPGAWTNGGGWRYLLEKKEGNRWTHLADWFGGEDNRKGGINKTIPITSEGWYRMAIATEPTSYAGDGSAGVRPFKSDCARGDFLRAMRDYRQGKHFEEGATLTVGLLHSGRVVTQKNL